MRAARKKSSVQYAEDEESDSEFLADPPAAVAETEEQAYFAGAGLSMIVEKILGRKIMPNPEDPSSLDELFFIKWKKVWIQRRLFLCLFAYLTYGIHCSQMSYLHASWERKEDIERVDSQGKGKIKRFLMTPQPPGILGEKPSKKSAEEGDDTNANDDDNDNEEEAEEDVEYYNPEMVEVHRIISCDTPTVSHATAKSSHDIAPKEVDENNPEAAPEFDPESEVQYLVKWRGLPYNECTWERWEDLKFYYHEVWEFWQRQRPPSPSDYFTSHPTVAEYQKLTVSPHFGETEDGETELTLRDYQLEGVNWLLWNWWNGRSCILADEMGLGKTIQSVGFLHQLRFNPKTKVNGPFLIVAPLSLINQWQGEIETWAPKMNCLVYHGSSEARDAIQQHEFYFQEPFTSKNAVASLRRANVCKFHILLTTFEMIIKDIRVLSKIDWKVCCCCICCYI
jgi:chromodomain-helicase-DNA-binding protein 7